MAHSNAQEPGRAAPDRSQDRSHGRSHGQSHGQSHGGVGIVLHSAARCYDLMTGLLLRGRERAFRERLVDLARLEPGERVLDVGCGTGSLAIAAARQVAAGAVCGIDASAEMIATARRKARKAGVGVRFENATVQALPFPDASFDAVLSTLMLHHVPRPARRQAVREVRRVLTPGGRLLVVDFTTPARERRGILARVHRHGHVDFDDVATLLHEAGFEVVDSGAVGVRDLHFALAKPSLPR
jgi:ubiquinone/menaquinone biosynthesis C-methylase UbiE